jgi:hypothetical protein
MAFTANSHPWAAMSVMRVTRSLKAIVTVKRAAVKVAKVPAQSRYIKLPSLQRSVEVLRER